MWEEEDDDDEPDVFDEMERRAHAILRQAVQGLHANLFDIDSKALKPLFRIEASEDEVVVTLDLPYVTKEGISLTATEETLMVEAKMRKAVTMRVGGSLQRDCEFEKYSKKIRLPVRVKPQDAKATFRNGILTVRYSISRKGNPVKIS